jgi:uncharacterized protein YdaL
MKRTRRSAWLRFLGGALPCLLFLMGADMVAALERPLAGRGVGAKTLLIYADAFSPYSLSFNLRQLQCDLRRVNTTLETVPFARVSASQLKHPDYIVVYCPQPAPVLPRSILVELAKISTPVLWVGFGADQILNFSSFHDLCRIMPHADFAPTPRVEYRGREWDARIEPWIPAQVKLSPDVQMTMKMLPPKGVDSQEHALCWKIRHITFYVSVTFYGTWSHLFADMLYDFFGVRKIPQSHVYIRIEDYHCRRDHRAFRRLVDYLHHRGHPFMVAVIPAYRDSETGEVYELEGEREFIEALKYAQRRGGRLVMHGFTHAHGNETGEGHEFWDVALDRPFEHVTQEFAAKRIRRGADQMIRNGLFPLAWETPHYAASSVVYRETAKVFSSAVEQIQLSDATYQENYMATGLTVDPYGRLLVPENLGFVAPSGRLSLDRIRDTSRTFAALRGSVIGCFFHPYISFDRFVELVEILEALDLPFLDLAEIGHWVDTGSYIVLTGDSKRNIPQDRNPISWTAFDAQGEGLQNERFRARPSDAKRRGVGMFEVIELGGSIENE